MCEQAFTYSYTPTDVHLQIRIFTGRYAYSRADTHIHRQIHIFTSAFEFTHAHTSIHVGVNFTPERSRVFTYEFLYERAPSYKTRARTYA
jgi:hypothetical protein